jgi:hypothetical protein
MRDLQLARDADAQRVVDEAAQLTGARRFSGPYALAAIPARYAVERGDWRQAAKVQPTATKYPFADAMSHFARALGTARSGDPASAESDVQQLAALRDAMEDKSEKHIVTLGRIVPARELLGDMLLQLKRPVEALKESRPRRRVSPTGSAGSTVRPRPPRRVATSPRRSATIRG